LSVKKQSGGLFLAKGASAIAQAKKPLKKTARPSGPTQKNLHSKGIEVFNAFLLCQKKLPLKLFNGSF